MTMPATAPKVDIQLVVADVAAMMLASDSPIADGAQTLVDLKVAGAERLEELHAELSREIGWHRLIETSAGVPFSLMSVVNNVVRSIV